MKKTRGGKREGAGRKLGSKDSLPRKRKFTLEEYKIRKLELQRDYALRVRMACLTFYSGNPPRCACCGEKELKFLAIDHINGGGSEHRKNFKGTINMWLKRNGFPDGFQVLCHNCNQAKGYYGSCPHVS